jgi:hypothetical protein
MDSHATVIVPRVAHCLAFSACFSSDEGGTLVPLFWEQVFSTSPQLLRWTSPKVLQAPMQFTLGSFL